MSKHTPGPWATDGGDTVVAMGNQIVVTAPAPDGASREEMKANARLIAAAPELLEALKGMLQAFLCTQDPDAYPSDAPCNLARAAIAKAVQS